MHLLGVVLRVSSVALALAALTVLFRRKLHRIYPWFTRYLFAIVAATGLHYVASGNRVAYFWVYWVTETFIDIFALLTVNQVFTTIFHEDIQDYPWLRHLLPGPAALFTVVYVVYATHSHPATFPIFVSMLYGFDLAVHLIETVVLICCLLLQKVFAAAWSSTDFGILAGFAISAAITILADYIRGERDLKTSRFVENFFGYGPPFAFIVAELVWLAAVSMPEPTPGSLEIRELVVLLKRDIRYSIRMWKRFGKR